MQRLTSSRFRFITALANSSTENLTFLAHLVKLLYVDHRTSQITSQLFLMCILAGVGDCANWLSMF